MYRGGEFLPRNKYPEETVQKILDASLKLFLEKGYEENMIKKVGGKPETRKFLENLGFVAGGTVTVVSTIGGNVIVKVKESRVAVSKEMAAKIMV